MEKFGEISLQDLALLGNVQIPEGGSSAFATRVLDADGDGRFDLFLMDGDNDGVIDGVVRGIDTNGDGVNDTFAHYNEDGTISSIGKMNPATGELEIIYEEPGFFEELLESLGLTDTGPPDEALFTSFDDPYIVETYGTFGQEYQDAAPATLFVEPDDIVDLDAYSDELGGAALATDYDVAPETAPDDSGSVAADTMEAVGTSSEQETADTGPTDSVARVTEIRDAGGGADGTTFWARVDTDGDSMSDTEELVTKSGSAYLSDINRDGYSEEIAFDRDGDNRIDAVDTTGRGLSGDQAAPSAIIAPDSDELADKRPGEDDGAADGAGSATDDWQVVAGDDDLSGTEQADTTADFSGADDYVDTSDTNSGGDMSGGGADYTGSGSTDTGTSVDVDSGTE